MLTVSAVLLVLVAGCSSVVTGAGGVPSPASSGSGSAPPVPTGSPSTSSAAARFPRIPLSTSVGDPVTADLCALAPLSAFDNLGYAPAYGPGVVPPGCAINMRKAGQVAFTVYAYGVGSNSFSHLTPLSPDQTKPSRTRTIHGIKVVEYPYLPEDGGSCIRNVLAQGLTLSVFSFTASGKPDEKANCAAADAMASVMARAAASGSAPRLQLARPSLTRLDFCAVLRATTISDINGFAGEPPKPDGVGDGCQIARGDSFDFYVDFALRNERRPAQSKPVTVGGHLLYQGTFADKAGKADKGQCKFTSPQGRTPGGYEVVSFYVSDSSSSAPDDLCKGAATAAGRFLDTAGLK